MKCIELNFFFKLATSGWIQGDYNFGCQPIDYSDNPKAMRAVYAFFWFYLLKLTELLETVFFALRKKFNQVSNLHLYHHVSTLCFAWIGCKFLAGKTQSLISDNTELKNRILKKNKSYVYVKLVIEHHLFTDYFTIDRVAII